MDISPKALREVEFREKKLGGYDRDDVDEFLEKIAVAIEILQERLRQAGERALRAEQRVSEVGEGDDAMRRTLVLAQRTADLALEEARQQAAAIVGEAQEQARHTAEDAGRELRNELLRLEAHREQLWSDVAVLGRWLQEERGRLRLAFGDVLRRLDEDFPALSPPPVLPTVTEQAAFQASEPESRPGYEEYATPQPDEADGATRFEPQF